MTSSRAFLPVVVEKFGGLNLEDDPSQIADNELVECINFNIDGGILSRRPGIDIKSVNPFASFEVRILGNFQDGIGASNPFILVNSGNGKVWRSYDGGVTWIECLSGGSPVNIQCMKTIPYFGNLYGITKSNQLMQIDNIGNIVFSSVTPNGYTGDVVLDRMFMWTLDQIVRYSDPGNFSLWPSTNTFYVGGGQFGDGEDIVGMVNYKDRLVIFKQDSIWILYMTGTPVNWQLKRFIKGIGATSYHGITVAEDYIYFVGQRGIYRTNLSTLEEISTKIAPLFNNRISMIGGSGGSSNYNYLWQNLDRVGYWNGKLIFALNFASSMVAWDYKYFIYDTVTETWVEWKFTNINPPTNFLSVTSAKSTTSYDDKYPLGLYFATTELSAISNFCYLHESNSKHDEGVYFPCSFKSKEYSLDEFSFERKKIPYTFLRANVGSDIEIETYYNDVLQFTYDSALNQDSKFKFKGPGYVNTFSMKMNFNNPTNGDNGNSDVLSFGYMFREPRPTLSDQRTSSL